MRTQCRAPVSCVFPEGARIYPGWRLGFRQSSFSHIARVPSARRPYASARPLVSWHALVPFTFQIQVSHQTQEYPPNPSRLHREYDRAPRGAGWYLFWFWFAGRPLTTPALAAFGMNPEGATFHLAADVGEERLPGNRPPRR